MGSQEPKLIIKACKGKSLNKANIMQDPVIGTVKVQYPETFDGRFFFTNWTNEDFVTMWDKVPYTFPANKTSPMIISGETLQGIQNVRKLFAEQLAEREYLKSADLRKLEGNVKVGEGTSLHSALSYAPLVKNRQTGEWNDKSPLAPLALKCLEPLQIAHAIQGVKVESEMKLRTDAKGKKVSRILEEGDSLVGDGQVVA